MVKLTLLLRQRLLRELNLVACEAMRFDLMAREVKGLDLVAHEATALDLEDLRLAGLMLSFKPVAGAET